MCRCRIRNGLRRSTDSIHSAVNDDKVRVVLPDVYWFWCGFSWIPCGDMTDSKDLLNVPTQDDLRRLNAFWQAFVDDPIPRDISPRDRMDAWIIKQRMIADRRASDRMTRATWALVLATIALVCVTIGQVVIAVLHH